MRLVFTIDSAGLVGKDISEVIGRHSFVGTVLWVFKVTNPFAVVRAEGGSCFTVGRVEGAVVAIVSD